MKTFKEFLDESSLSRIKSKSDKGGMAALSASRADKSAKENRARAKQLDRDIRGRGLGGATKVTGSYMEKDKKTGTLSATRKGGLGKSKNVKLGKFKPQGKNPEGQSQIKGKTFTYG